MALKSTKLVQMKMRVPEPLHRLLEDAAHRSRRSLTQEAVHRLQQSFSREVTRDIITTTAMRTGTEIQRDLFEHINRILVALNRPDLAIHLKQEDESNG